jgi:hypothetical protein
MLMLTWQVSPGKFIDNELDIPESRNGIPDILDEAAWLIRFFHRTRHAIMNAGYGTGGVGSRVCGDHFGGDGEGVPSWKDVNRTWIVSGEDPHTTFKYAGLAAQMAFCLKKLAISDPESVDWEKEAREAYQWAISNTRAGDENTKPAMGYLLKDIRAFASASLYQLTGQIVFHDKLKADLSTLSANTSLNEESRWAPFIYATLPVEQETESNLKSRCTAAILKAADDQLFSAGNRACRWGGNYWFPMLVGQGTTPMIFETIMAWHLVKDPVKANQYLSMIFNTADYFLGTNPLNQTWITGLGIRRPERVFHLDAWYNGKNEMHPGITPYGPWRDESYFTGQGAWDVKWSYKSIYPNSIQEWPGHERWFGNSTCPLNAEFTVHQNTVLNTVVYGFLCSAADGTFIPNRRPVIGKVEISKPGYQNDTLAIRVVSYDPDGNSSHYKAEFFNDWHKIGEETEFPYQLKWAPTSQQVKLKVKITDILGAQSEKEISFRTDTVTGSFLQQRKPSGVKVYPNPSGNSFRFSLTGAAENGADIRIYTENGVLIHSYIASCNNGMDYIWIPARENCPPGTYLYRVSMEENPETFHSGKLVYRQL